MAKQISKKLAWLAVAAVVLINSVILSKVYINRSEVVAQLPLTERELSSPYHYGFAKEDSGRRIKLRWTTPDLEPVSDEWRYRYWHSNSSLILSQQHFASFQFRPCQPERYRRQQQSGWVLLEFNGPGYLQSLAQAEQYYGLAQQPQPELTADALSEKQQRSAEYLKAAKHSATRLYVIDAAADPALLQSVLAARPATADSRLVIVPAEVQAGYSRCSKTEQAKPTEIIVNRLAVESLYVPKHLAQALPQNKQTEFTAPFQATVNYGKLNEPWISSLE